MTHRRVFIQGRFLGLGCMLGVTLLAWSAAWVGAEETRGASERPWHTSLCLGNDGYWRQRIRLVVHNPADHALVGEPVDVTIGKAQGQVDIEGMVADALRLVDDAGGEMLWAIADPAGKAIERGPIPSGSVLTIPADCPAQGDAGYFLYFDNPSAWAVPDFLAVVGGLRNGDLELGEGGLPIGWQHDASDAKHHTTWVDEPSHSGRKCLKTIVEEGAPSTWISTRQTQIRIVGGARYVMRGWVKGANVKGEAGWYIHVGNAGNSMLLSPMLRAGGGTFDWKEVKAEFTAPKDANRANVGTVLHGAGRAWFDDVSLERLDTPVSVPTVRVSRPERLEGLREVGGDAPWPDDAQAREWNYRIPVRVLNVTRQAVGAGLVSVDLSSALARLGRQVDLRQVQVRDQQREVASYCLGRLLLFEGSVDAMTRRTFYVYFRRGPGAVATPEATKQSYAANPALPGAAAQETRQNAPVAEYQRLLASQANRVKNPDFEAGDPLPEHWSGGAKNQHPAAVEMGLDSRGLFGRRCVRIAYPESSSPQWVGWRQDVPVEPGRSYLLAAWLKCQKLAGSLQLHVHYHNTQGKLCRDAQMGGAGPAISGDTDWTLMQGLFTAPADAASFQLHLTMHAQGTAWHDGVVVAEVAPGRLGSIEMRSSRSPAELAVWPVPALVKVFRGDVPPVAPAPARIELAGNECEPLQLVLRSERAVGQVRVTVDLPVGPSGRQLSDVTVGVVGYVPIDHPTNYYSSKTPAWHRKVPTGQGSSDGWADWWPDPILPRSTLELTAHASQPVWLTVAASADAAAGDYQGRVRFMSGETVLAQVPFTVHVWSFSLPDEMHLKAIFDCRQTGPLWSVPGKSAEETRREFWQFMAKRRACPDRIHPEPVFHYEQGQATADFTAFDAAAEYYFNTLKFPHSYTPSKFYGFGWGFPPPALFGQQPYEGSWPFPGVDRGKLRLEYKQAYKACLKLFWDHIKAKGWERKFTLYISDEPFDAQEPIRKQMRALCEMIHEVDPTIPIYSSTWHHQPQWDGYLSVWGIGHYGIVPVSKLKEILAGGAKFWWTTDGQMCTDTPYCAAERLLPYFCFKYGAEAYEFWGIDWLTYDPYAFGWHRYIHQSDEPGKEYFVRYPNGDGYLAYPGKPIGQAGAVTSIRLEQVREGCEDYEYLELLRAAVAKAKAAGRDVTEAERTLASVRELVSIPNAGGLQSARALPDPGAVFDLRRRVARAIESLR